MAASFDRLGAAARQRVTEKVAARAKLTLRPLCPAHGSVASQSDAMHDAAVAGIVVHGVVLGAAVVPEGEGARLPPEATRELRPDLVAIEERQNRCALLLRHAVEPHRVRDIDVERLAAGLRMHPNDRMRGLVQGARVGAPALGNAILARAGGIRLRGAVDGA